MATAFIVQPVESYRDGLEVRPYEVEIKSHGGGSNSSLTYLLLIYQIDDIRSNPYHISPVLSTTDNPITHTFEISEVAISYGWLINASLSRSHKVSKVRDRFLEFSIAAKPHA